MHILMMAKFLFQTYSYNSQFSSESTQSIEDDPLSLPSNEEKNEKNIHENIKRYALMSISIFLKMKFLLC